METKKREIFVIGHRNPDTDSICSAIAYANLKRQTTGRKYVAKRAGVLNEETSYVLKKFHVEAPGILSDVRLQVRDIDMHEIESVDPNASIKTTWACMKEQSVKTMPITKDQELIGVITTGDIASSYMDAYDNEVLSKARTQYRNIIRTLDGTLLTGNEHGYFSKGRVVIAASDAGVMNDLIQENDLVILGNIVEKQLFVIDLNVSCMVICNGKEVEPDVLKKAENKGIVVITSPYDTFTVAKLINQSVPVKHYMTKMPLTTFQETDFVDDILPVMTNKKYRDFPILDKYGRLQGFISRRRFLNSRKKKVVLVDHNEKSQAVEGIEEAEVIEIIDHHRLNSIETLGPVMFRNQPVGCTATIIYQMYNEEGVEITPTIAGLLCSAIISDTLLFRSPTCTRLDEAVAGKLAAIAGINMEEMAQNMFRAGSDLSGKTADEICFQDFKTFKVNDLTVGVGQINSMSKDELREIKAKLEPHFPAVLQENRLHMVLFMLTDIMDESTEVICCGDGARRIVTEAFNISEQAQRIILSNVVSRKKQFVPEIMRVLQEK